MERAVTEQRRTGESYETIAHSSTTVESPIDALSGSELPGRYSSSDVPVVDGAGSGGNDATGAE